MAKLIRIRYESEHEDSETAIFANKSEYEWFKKNNDFEWIEDWD